MLVDCNELVIEATAFTIYREVPPTFVRDIIRKMGLERGFWLRWSAYSGRGFSSVRWPVRFGLFLFSLAIAEFSCAPPCAEKGMCLVCDLSFFVVVRLGGIQRKSGHLYE